MSGELAARRSALSEAEGAPYQVNSEEAHQEESQAQIAEDRRGLRKTGKATEGERGMPGCQEPKKDVAHCEKRRGAVCRRRSGGVRMGEPGRAERSPGAEHIGPLGGTRGTETSQYPEEKRAFRE